MPDQETTSVRSSPGEVISQSEVESLLAQMRGGEVAGTDAEAPWGASGKSATAVTERHEFREFSSFSATEMRKLRVRHEEFVRALAARLSIYLRLEVAMQMARLETVPFARFVDGLQSPTHISSIKLNPLDGVCLLDIPCRLGLCIVDRELGGPGICLEDTRDLSQIEARLLSEVVALVFTEWCASWNDLLDLSPVVLSHENNGKFVQGIKPDEIMLVLGLEVQIGELVEHIHLAFPYGILESLVAKLQVGLDTKKVDPAKPARPDWNPALATLEVPLSCELPQLQLTARQIASLKPGDVVPFSADLVGQVRLCLNRVPKFVGVLGVRGQCSAIQIEKRF